MEQNILTWVRLEPGSTAPWACTLPLCYRSHLRNLAFFGFLKAMIWFCLGKAQMAPNIICNKPFVSSNSTNNSKWNKKIWLGWGLNPDHLLRKPVLYHCATGVFLENYQFLGSLKTVIWFRPVAIYKNDGTSLIPVSYTHLTLPTIYSV